MSTKLPFKAAAESALMNATFLGKDCDDTTTGTLGLLNTDNPDSGDTIDNAQRYINEIADASGVAGEGDATSKNYSSNNYISNGDDRKVAIGKLDAGIQAVLDQVNEGAITLKAYADDASYQSDNDDPPYVGLTGIYYNTTTGLIRYYDGVEAEWSNVGSGGVGNREEIGTGDGVTTDFALTLFPTSDESVIVFRNGLAVDPAEYSVSAGVVSFLVAPAAAQLIVAFYLTEGTPVSPPVSGTFNVDYLEVDATALLNKEVTLTGTPAVVTQVIVDVIGGSSQRYGVDYTVSGTTLDWDSLGLDGEVSLGDYLRVQYFS